MFGFGDKNKVYKVTISNTGETFEVNGKINLLQAAKNAGIEWPVSYTHLTLPTTPYV